MADSKNALQPATITHLDMRSRGAEVADSCHRGDRSARPLRLCTWNIERGYKLDLVIQQLKEIDADILSLQELDIGCDRSGGVDTFTQIATALRLNGLFLCEFEELRSPLRDAKSQGGGVHGNAVFSRFRFTSWRVLEHTHHPVDWEADPQPHACAAREPRRGRRVTLVADVAAPGGDIRVYNTHLEVFCGILGRAWQFSDILRDVKASESHEAAAAAPTTDAAASGAAATEVSLAAQWNNGGSCDKQQEQQQEQQTLQPRVRRYAILGDLNTMANGVARLSANYCCDKLRWQTLGLSEAQYWQRYIFSCVGKDPAMVNTHFLKLGLPVDVCSALVNPGFFDPFDAAVDITLDNPTYRLGPLHLMTGKLDWVLLRDLMPSFWYMANLTWAASDHRALVVEVT